MNGPMVRLRTTHRSHSVWRGRIVRSVGEVDSGTRMMAVVANVTDPYRQAEGASGSALSFGMFVKAEIDGREMKDVFVLPREVLRGADAVHIFKDGKLYARKVRMAWSTRKVVVVAEGLQAGEQVCLTPVDAFVEGMSVILMEGSGGE